MRIRADVQAFSDNFDYLCRLLRRLGVRADDVEDLAQEVFVVMCRRWSEYQPQRSLRAWLAGIAFNTAQKYFARVWRESPTEGLDLPDLGPQPDERLQAARARWLVQQALDDLSVRDRAVLSLRELDDLSMHEVADALKVPLFTAYTRLRRARTRFAAAVSRLERPTAAPLSAAAALAVERQATPSSPEETRRAVERALSLIRGLIPTAPPPRPRADEPSRSNPARPGWRPPRLGPVGVGLAGALVVAMGGLLVSITSGDRKVAAMSVAGSGAPAPAAAPVRLAAALAGRDRLALPVFVRQPVPPLVATLGQGLTGYWRFDEGPGSDLARDLSPARRDCLLHDVDAEGGWQSGALGGGLDVGRGWLQCSQPAIVARSATETTVAAWVRATAFPSIGFAALVARQLAEDRRDYFFLGLRGRRLVVSGRYWGAGVTATREVPRGRMGACRLHAGGRWHVASLSGRRPGRNEATRDKGPAAADRHAADHWLGPERPGKQQSRATVEGGRGRSADL